MQNEQFAPWGNDPYANPVGAYSGSVENNQPGQDYSGGGFFDRAVGPADAIRGGADWWKAMEQDTFVNLPQQSTRKSKKRRPKKNVARPGSDDGEESEETKPKTEIPPMYIYQDRPSARIWTIMAMIISLAATGCSIFYTGSLSSISSNPMFGGNETSLIALGAQYPPFILDGEWWRFGTSIFLHPGLISLCVCLCVMASFSDIESKGGFGKAFLTFILPGLFSNIISAIFVPTAITCGSEGALLGWMGMSIVEVLMTSEKQKTPYFSFFSRFFTIIALVVLGLFQYGNILRSLSGLVFGILISFVMMPGSSTSSCATIFRGILTFLAFPILATIFSLALVYFYRRVVIDDGNCDICGFIQCFKFGDWCSQ